MAQIANSFDKETIIKIIKGGFIAATGAGAIAFLEYIGGLEISNVNLATLIAFLVPFLVNLVKEFLKGK